MTAATRDWADREPATNDGSDRLPGNRVWGGGHSAVSSVCGWTREEDNRRPQSETRGRTGSRAVPYTLAYAIKTLLTNGRRCGFGTFIFLHFDRFSAVRSAVFFLTFIRVFYIYIYYPF